MLTNPLFSVFSLSTGITFGTNMSANSKFIFRVATGNPVVFTLSPPECYMEIRYGYGTAGNRVGGPVRVGDPLTLIIYMRSKYGKYENYGTLEIPEWHLLCYFK